MNAGYVERTEPLIRLIGTTYLAGHIARNRRNMGLWLICATINAIFSDLARLIKAKKQWTYFTNTDKGWQCKEMDGLSRTLLRNSDGITSDFPGEVWKDIPGYEGLYKVSDLGSILNLHTNKFLKKRLSTNGYYVVDLRKNHRSRVFRVHRLVALSFIPFVDGKPFVNHVDGNKLNNNVSNLEWCTQSENVYHAYNTGLNKRKLDINESEILELYKTCSATEIAKRKNVSVTAIISRLNKNGVDTSIRKSGYGIDLSVLLNEIKSGTKISNLAKKYGCSMDLISQQKYKFKKKGLL